MQSTPIVQPLIDPIGPLPSAPPLVANIPLSSSTIQPIMSTSPLVTSIPPTVPGIPPPPTAIPHIPPNVPVGIPPLPTGVPPIASVIAPVNTVAPMGGSGMSPVTGQPLGIQGVPRPSASSTPRASITSLERTHSIESVS